MPSCVWRSEGQPLKVHTLTSTTCHVVSLEQAAGWKMNTGTAEFNGLVKGVTGYSISHNIYQQLVSLTTEERTEGALFASFI